MYCKIKTGDLAKVATRCVVVGVFDTDTLSGPAEALDRASGGALSALVGKGDLTGRAGSCLMAYDLPGVQAERVLLVGYGKREELDRKTYGKVLGAALSRLGESGVTEAVWTFDELPAELDLYRAARLTVEQAAASTYRYEQTKTPPADAPARLKVLDLWVADEAERASVEGAAAHGQAIAAGVALARDLGNLPGNVCTPGYLAERALELAGNHAKMDVEVLEENDMDELGMGALLSVSRGSRQPAKLIVFQYRGANAEDKPVVLVGKGLTFDAGGISIKPAEAMDEMKYDMCGGASVFGAMAATCEMDLPLNLIGVVPASENLPDGAANKPGDIVTSMSGQTIEILNTDAEGRLILCDALTYVERFAPALVVDMATLTGACIVALGRHPSGLFSADEDLAAEITAAGQAAGDRAWRLPLWDDYHKQLESNFADIANIGGRDGGAVTAACFLSKFTKKYRWAHLDIAGTAWLTGKEKGATGRPVPLLGEFLLRRAGMQP